MPESFAFDVNLEDLVGFYQYYTVLVQVLNEAPNFVDPINLDYQVTFNETNTIMLREVFDKEGSPIFFNCPDITGNIYVLNCFNDPNFGFTIDAKDLTALKSVIPLDVELTDTRNTRTIPIKISVIDYPPVLIGTPEIQQFKIQSTEQLIHIGEISSLYPVTIEYKLEFGQRLPEYLIQTDDKLYFVSSSEDMENCTIQIKVSNYRSLPVKYFTRIEISQKPKHPSSFEQAILESMNLDAPNFKLPFKDVIILTVLCNETIYVLQEFVDRDNDTVNVTNLNLGYAKDFVTFNYTSRTFTIFPKSPLHAYGQAYLIQFSLIDNNKFPKSRDFSFIIKVREPTLQEYPFRIFQLCITSKTPFGFLPPPSKPIKTALISIISFTQYGLLHLLITPCTQGLIDQINEKNLKIRLPKQQQRQITMFQIISKESDGNILIQIDFSEAKLISLTSYELIEVRIIKKLSYTEKDYQYLIQKNTFAKEMAPLQYNLKSISISRKAERAIIIIAQIKVTSSLIVNANAAQLENSHWLTFGTSQTFSLCSLSMHSLKPDQHHSPVNCSRQYILLASQT
ncbi:hypothetical protein FGO68_gene10676 [Halteria grandinella]|uniref:Uncharacterized protein n=1 Tax=Halteria grandinella TaxID=5974 RepID=A0A8J8P9I4_HALGN|nr:hypothetical protein FGO68_gene10676 [Halteria grandinella]